MPPATGISSNRGTTTGFCHDETQWNGAILAMGGSIYQSWQWGELRRGEGWTPWRVLVENSEGVVGALQILEWRLSPLPTGVMYAPRPTLQGLSAWPPLVAWLKEFMRTRRVIVLRTDPEILDTDETSKTQLQALGFSWLRDQEWSAWGNLPRAWMLIDIRPPTDVIFARMGKEHRRLIRKAETSGCAFDNGTTLEHLADLYGMLVKSGERQQFTVLRREYFTGFSKTLFKDGRGTVFVARHNGQPIAAIVCACFGSSCYYLYGGFDFEYHYLNVNHILHWKAIQWAKFMGCDFYNMIGSGTRYPPHRDNHGFSLYDFKKGFGADLYYYAGYFDLPGPWPAYSLVRYIEQHANARAYSVLKVLKHLVGAQNLSRISRFAELDSREVGK